MNMQGLTCRGVFNRFLYLCFWKWLSPQAGSFKVRGLIFPPGLVSLVDQRESCRNKRTRGLAWGKASQRKAEERKHPVWPSEMQSSLTFKSLFCTPSLSGSARICNNVRRIPLRVWSHEGGWFKSITVVSEGDCSQNHLQGLLLDDCKVLEWVTLRSKT